MATDQDLIKLYSQRILALAANISQTEPIDAPDASVKERSPLCGSSITVSLNMEGDTISAYSQDVKACALGQAAASILGKSVVGLDKAEVQNGRDALFAMLKENGPLPTAPFEDLEVLSSAKDYKNRHASIMLAFDATLGAIELAQKKTASSETENAVS